MCPTKEMIKTFSEKRNTMENKMGYEKEGRLLLTMALPIMLSASVQALYNVVDAVFVSKLGENALAAITFSSPAVTALTAVGMGISVGMNTMLSQGLGEKNENKVNDAATAGIVLGLCGCLLAALGAAFLIAPYLRSQTDNSDIYQKANTYISIYLYLGVGTIGQLIFERMLMASGKTLYSMISQGIGAMMNLLLDPILIFGMFGLPKMEIAGAAFATVSSQMVAMGTGILLNRKVNKNIQLKWKISVYAVKQVLILGLPTTILLLLNSFMTVNFNMVLNRFSSSAVVVFGVCSRLGSFCYAIANGVCSALIPIVAFNYGARKKGRIVQTMKWGYFYTVAIMGVSTILCESFPERLLKMFHATEEMLEIGVWGIRMICLCYVCIAIRIVSTSTMQALGHSIPAMLVDLIRNYGCIIPLAWTFASMERLDLVWVSIPIADTVSAVAGFLLMRFFYRRDICPVNFCTDRNGG